MTTNVRARRGAAGGLVVTMRQLIRLAACLVVLASPPLFAQANLKALLASIPDSSWIKVNQNNYSDVWVPADLQVPPYAGDSKPGSIIAAWSSFAWDPNRGDLILWGGGHANYGGNEVYRWRGSTQLWERGSVPSEVKSIAYATYEAIDGAAHAPVASHTYDNQNFLPRLDRFITFGGAAFDTGGGEQTQLLDGTVRNTGPFLWDPSKADPNKVGGTTGSHVQRTNPHPEIVGGNMWQNLDVYDGRFPLADMPSTFVNCVSDVTLENGFDTIYISGRMGGGVDQDLFRYQIQDLNDRSKDTWQRVGIGWWGISNKGAGIYDPVRRAFIRMASGNSVSYWDISTAGPNNRDVVVQLPSVGESLTEDFGMDLEPDTGELVYWGGGGAVWKVRPPTPIAPTGWTVTKQPNPVGSVPSTNVGTGILGKFKFAKNLGAFVALEVSGDVWLYRPVGWVDPDGNNPPTVSLTAPANGTTLPAPANVTITATASDSDGVVTRVDFFAGTSFLGTAAAAPWSFTWTSVPAGSYSITAVATDNGGGQTTSTPVAITVTSGGGGSAVNVAAAASGATATASSTYPGYPATAVIDGDRKGINWGNGGGWNDATAYAFPDWVQVNFAGAKSIGEIDVFTLQDAYSAPATPTLATTFASYGITDFQVQYWSSNAWINIPGGVVTGNQNVWRQFTFAPVSTDRIRVLVNNALAGYSRVVEIEAWTSSNVPPVVSLTSPTNGSSAVAPASIGIAASASDSDGSIARVDFYAGSTLIGSDSSAPYGVTWSNVAAGTYTLTAVAFDNANASTTSAPVSVTVNGATSVNVALSANGGVASASSTYSSGYAPAGAIDGERAGIRWAQGGGWNDATADTFPDWLQVNFNGQKTINRIDVFTVQDNYQSPVDPTPAMTFAFYGLTAFDVQTWDGTTWTTVPGGSVTNNNHVWRTFAFPSIVTDRIRVLAKAGLTHSRITELEAWTP
jgi:hypothetical protein